MADQIAKASINGVCLDASGGVGWELRTGTSPVIRAFVCDAAAADQIAGFGTTPLTLRLSSPSGKTIEVSNLYYIGQGPSPDPYRKTILIADRRIFWRQKRIFMRCNIRRRSGERRRLSQDGVPVQIEQIAADLVYAPWSLDGGIPFTARRMVEVALNRIAKPWAGSLGNMEGRQVQDVEIDDEGGTGLERAMNYLVGADGYMDLNGTYQIIDALDLKATHDHMRDLFEKSPIIDDGSYPRRTDKRTVRPQSVRVLFDVEQEVRFDSMEESTPYANQDTRYMENVAPIPDPTLTVNGRTAVAGEYVAFPTLLTSWGSIGDFGVSLDFATIRQFWHTPHLEALFGGLGELAPTASWVERIATVRAHYRQTYRISRRWMDRIFQLRPYRVSIIDTETGVYGRAQAYSGYCIIPATKGLFTDLFKQQYMLNVDGSISSGQPLSSGRVSPAIVSILDPETGIIRLDYHVDLLHNFRQIIPSKVTNVPTLCPTIAQNRNPITIDGSVLGDAGASVELDPDHSVTVVLTVVPAAPNGKAQLHGIPVMYHEALQKLPDGAVSGPAEGPEWELRVGGQIATARFAWSDALASAIETAMGVGLSVDDPRIGNRDALGTLLLNPQELKDMATSMAAALYASLADHWIGDYRTDFQPNSRPIGSIRSVEHSLDVDGQLNTILRLRDDMVPIDPMALLSDSARRLFLRTVQP